MVLRWKESGGNGRSWGGECPRKVMRGTCDGYCKAWWAGGGYKGEGMEIAAEGAEGGWKGGVKGGEMMVKERQVV